jgi:hypothetical protein
VTSLAAWTGVDSRGPSSIYIATDSRISWQDPSGLIVQAWDSGRKTAALAASPHIFGFAGDVLYPSQTLDAIGDLLAFSPEPRTVEEAQEGFREAVKSAWKHLPPKERRASFLVHCLRLGDGMGSQFGMQIMHQPAGSDSWTARTFSMPHESSRLEFIGSGTKSLEVAHAKWVQVPASPSGQPQDTRMRTSRAVFSAFCDSLQSGKDAASGGAPQLVGLYREGNGRRFGVHWNENPYIAGMDVLGKPLEGVEWRNRYFERTNERGELLPRAQRHATSPAR